jgi:transcriptional regulator with PAS, ATPase and Fis domain
VFEVGHVSKRKCQIRAKDGRIVHLLKNAVVLKDSNGEAIGAVEAMTDVTSLYMKELEVEELRSELQQEYGFMGLLGTSPAMQRLYEQIQNTAMSEAPVMIYGESGTGKELVARAIHKLSKRHNGPFVAVNCSALNEFLLESELFGHVKGAFTGAVRDRQGRFEAARNGSIFLDEIGDMPLSMQAKLLRVLQEWEIERVGDHRSIPVKVRLIAATNKDLRALVEQGRIREDFFYRVNVIPIYVPPLRERKGDIPILTNHFLKRISLVNQTNTLNINSKAMDAMEAYHWPGNVRQLINALEFAAMTCRNETIDVADLPEYIFHRYNRMDNEKESHYKNRENIASALSRCGWNRTLAAKELGISSVTLWKIMKEFDIKAEDTIVR